MECLQWEAGHIPHYIFSVDWESIRNISALPYEFLKQWGLSSMVKEIWKVFDASR